MLAVVTDIRILEYSYLAIIKHDDLLAVNTKVITHVMNLTINFINREIDSVIKKIVTPISHQGGVAYCVLWAHTLTVIQKGF